MNIDTAYIILSGTVISALVAYIFIRRAERKK